MTTILNILNIECCWVRNELPALLLLCCDTAEKTGRDLVQRNSLHTNPGQPAVLLELLVEQQQRGVEGEHRSGGSDYLNIKDQTQVWELTVCVGGKDKRSIGKIYRMINHFEKILQTKLASSSWISDFVFMPPCYNFFWWYKNNQKIFFWKESQILKYFFFHGKIFLLHLFHWNIEVKWESWKLARLLLIETYLQGCFTAYNFLYSQTIRRQCLVWTLQSRQVMDITGTYWQHSHHSHPSQVLVSLVFWQSRHVLAIRVPLSGEPSSQIYDLLSVREPGLDVEKC